MCTKKKQAFTLVELMVVICVIAILMAISFKLMRMASYDKAIAETKAKMERIQNALNGYHAYYGYFPPVPFYYDLDPGKNDHDYDSAKPTDSFGQDEWAERANLAARAQPMVFNFPTPSNLDEEIPRIFQRKTPPMKVVAINQLVDNISQGSGSELQSWEELRVFKFGLISYLLPRLEVVNGHLQPLNPKVFLNQQWLANNPGTPRKILIGNKSGGELNALMNAQRQAEEEVCAKWLPHLEETVSGLIPKKILGINIQAPGSQGGTDGKGFEVKSFSSAHPDLVASAQATCYDAWGEEFYYHSLPPYQSYIIWSAGPNKKTYPPWIDSKDGDYLHPDRKKKILEWIQDDIVGGSL